MMYKLSAYLLVLSSFVIFSCKKIIIETVPVIQYADISIPKAGDIKHFSFPGANVGYAACDTNFIYKTINGGKTWSVITNSNWSTYVSCKGIVFFDELNGFCLMGGVAYSTKDGGATWTVSNSWYGGNSTVAFCGMTSTGVGVMGRYERYGYVSLYYSSDKGKTFNQFDVIVIPGGIGVLGGRISGDFITVFTDEISQNIYGLPFSLTSSTNQVQFYLSSTATDFYTTAGTSGIAVGEDGCLADCYSAYSTYNHPVHKYDYYSIDGKDGLIIAVGDNTIVSNIDIGSEEEWNHVLDVHGNGFTQKFFMILFSGHREFYISGEKGLIWKATI